jgi:hypothetical protein
MQDDPIRGNAQSGKDDAPIRQKVVAIGKWKAQIPAVRSVFDLGMAA